MINIYVIQSKIWYPLLLPSSYDFWSLILQLSIFRHHIRRSEIFTTPSHFYHWWKKCCIWLVRSMSSLPSWCHVPWSWWKENLILNIGCHQPNISLARLHKENWWCVAKETSQSDPNQIIMIFQKYLLKSCFMMWYNNVMQEL